MAVIDEIGAYLVPGQVYVVDTAADGVWLRGDDGRAAARLPVTPGGAVASGSGGWWIAAERQGQRGVVVAREPTGDQPVGCAYPSGWLNRFDLWVAPDREYRLREKPWSASWILRGDLGELARFVPGRSRRIALAETLTPEPHVALLILLACQAIRYIKLIPNTDAGCP